MKRPSLAVVARALAGPLTLLPRLPHRHRWDDDMCVPASCTICGRIGYPLATMHDVFTDD